MTPGEEALWSYTHALWLIGGALAVIAVALVLREVREILELILNRRLMGRLFNSSRKDTEYGGFP